MKGKISKRAAVVIFLTVLLICAMIAVGGISAYLTDRAPSLDNNFTIALDVSHVIVEKFPYNPDTGKASTKADVNGAVAKYSKAVQVANTGYVDEYVRVKIDFTDSSIMGKTKFSNDGTNYYWADPNRTASGTKYIDKLPDGWVYNKTDGFYYYTKILVAGDWDKIEKNLVYDKTQFRYFYKDKDPIIENNPIITTPLFRYVDSTFNNAKDVKSYGINIIAQSCPFYTGANYADAWKNYNPNDF